MLEKIFRIRREGGISMGVRKGKCRELNRGLEREFWRREGKNQRKGHGQREEGELFLWHHRPGDTKRGSKRKETKQSWGNFLIPH